VSDAPKTRKPLSADAVRAAAEREYAAGTPLPEAIRKIDARAKRPTIGIVSPVYWRLLGAESPIPGKSETARNNALAKRRKSGVRFEVLAASLAVSVGRAVSVAEVKNRLAKSGLDSDRSYVGRGTRKSASGEATRVSAETAR
jgi:hypothetical protein